MAKEDFNRLGSDKTNQHRPDPEGLCLSSHDWETEAAEETAMKEPALVEPTADNLDSVATTAYATIKRPSFDLTTTSEHSGYTRSNSRHQILADRQNSAARRKTHRAAPSNSEQVGDSHILREAKANIAFPVGRNPTLSKKVGGNTDEEHTTVSESPVPSATSERVANAKVPETVDHGRTEGADQVVGPSPGAVQEPSDSAMADRGQRKLAKLRGATLPAQRDRYRPAAGPTVRIPEANPISARVIQQEETSQHEVEQLLRELAANQTEMEVMKCKLAEMDHMRQELHQLRSILREAPIAEPLLSRKQKEVLDYTELASRAAVLIDPIGGLRQRQKDKRDRIKKNRVR